MPKYATRWLFSSKFYYISAIYCQLYKFHEKWMEEKANTGVQLDPKDEDVTYEQNNLKK